jgi:hypothetical protein
VLFFPSKVILKREKNESHAMVIAQLLSTMTK